MMEHTGNLQRAVRSRPLSSWREQDRALTMAVAFDARTRRWGIHALVLGIAAIVTYLAGIA
jgi:hypothetical protein